MTNKRRPMRFYLGLAFAFLVAALAWQYLLKTALSEAEISGTRVRPPRSALDIKFLGEQSIKSFADLKGKWSVVFFGFTACPDICPTALAQLREEYAGLLENRPFAQIIFVSIDPTSDTPEKAMAYAKGFDEQFIGLVPENLDQLQAFFGLTIQREPEMAHSGDYFIINPKGQWSALYRPPVAPGLLSKDLRNLILVGS
jgi:protein SCO1/2